jgi:SAM-dependent methyltransferase
LENELRSKPENWINYQNQKNFGENSNSPLYYSLYLPYTIPLVKLLYKYLIKPEIKLIGDLGCGNSIWLRFLSKNFSHKKFIGIDFKKSTLSSGINKNTNQNMNLILGDISHLPFKSKKFDFLFSLGVIEHFPEHILVLKDWIKSLRIGGYLLITVPNARRLDSLIVYILNSYVNRLRGTGESLSFSIYDNRIITNLYGYEERWSSKNFKKIAQKLDLKLIETFGFRISPPLPGFLYLLPSNLRRYYFKLFSSFKANVKNALTIGAIYIRNN